MMMNILLSGLTTVLKNLFLSSQDESVDPLARREKKMTTRDLASVTGVSQQTISSYENGKVEPNAIKFIKICTALDIDLNIFKNSENKESLEKRVSDLENLLADKGILAAG